MQSDDHPIVTSSLTNPKKRAISGSISGSPNAEIPDADMPYAKKVAMSNDVVQAVKRSDDFHHLRYQYCDDAANASTEEHPSAKSLAVEADRLKFKPEMSAACKLGFMHSSKIIIDRLFITDTEERHRQYAFQCTVTHDELSRAMALDKITPGEWLTELSTDASYCSKRQGKVRLSNRYTANGKTAGDTYQSTDAITAQTDGMFDTFLYPICSELIADFHLVIKVVEKHDVWPIVPVRVPFTLGLYALQCWRQHAIDKVLISRLRRFVPDFERIVSDLSVNYREPTHDEKGIPLYSIWDDLGKSRGHYLDKGSYCSPDTRDLPDGHVLVSFSFA